mmetsp:Transcript_32454/g.82012  ORF Transcript_32454/g.82012 Transcript_32454/m.82012 type:complete len:215 (-) Transcript_32454:748-1392(-)
MLGKSLLHSGHALSHKFGFGPHGSPELLCDSLRQRLGVSTLVFLSAQDANDASVASQVVSQTLRRLCCGVLLSRSVLAVVCFSCFLCIFSRACLLVLGFLFGTCLRAAGRRRLCGRDRDRTWQHVLALRLRDCWASSGGALLLVLQRGARRPRELGLGLPGVGGGGLLLPPARRQVRFRVRRNRRVFAGRALPARLPGAHLGRLRLLSVPGVRL